MISGLFYLQYHLLKNRTLVRLKRLRQPKYLAGAVVGGLYFYFYFFRYLFGFGAPRPNASLAVLPDSIALYESLGALLVLMVILLGWFVPHGRAALTFTEAEIAFLFPAPLSRSGLIHYKLLRSQSRILFTTFFLTIIANRFGGKAWIHATGLWIALSILNLHSLGSSFARTMLLDRGITNWQRRIAILCIFGAAAGLVVIWIKRTLPPLDLSQFQNIGEVRDYALQVLNSGPTPYLLYPFRLVVRPYLAPNGHAFIAALWPAFALLLLHYFWVARSDVAFEEASIEASKKLAEKVAAVRSGNWQTTRQNRKPKRAPFRLNPLGFQPVALLWKNLMSAGQAFTPRLWIVLASVTLGLGIGLRGSAGNADWLTVIGMLAGMLIIWSLLLGPQFFRQDLRQDLLMADVLKSYPMRGWQIVLGELLAPASILTGMQWFLLIVAATFPSGPFSAGANPSQRLALIFGAAILLPFLNLITLQIPNASVLLFPAWFQASKEGAKALRRRDSASSCCSANCLCSWWPCFLRLLCSRWCFFFSKGFVATVWLFHFRQSRRLSCSRLKPAAALCCSGGSLTGSI